MQHAFSKVGPLKCSRLPVIFALKVRHASAASFIERCPEPTCNCARSPEGLEIDRESKLRNTVSFHRRHIVVNTRGKQWPSRFEDDTSSYAAKVKTTFGKNGALFDPRNLPLISAARFPSGALPEDDRLLIFPDFLRVPQPGSGGGKMATITQRVFEDSATQEDVNNVLNALRSHLNWPNDVPGRIDPREAASETMGQLQAINKPTILICGHGARDERCGIMGPLLQKQFQDVLEANHVDAIVGQITHIGGHKFAGNVILYVPPAPAATQSHKALAGKSVWYGRVEPRHCEGIVKETMLGGKVIEELYRGSMAGAEP